MSTFRETQSYRCIGCKCGTCMNVGCTPSACGIGCCGALYECGGYTDDIFEDLDNE